MTANFNMQDQFITVVRGDTLSFGVEIVDQYGEALDIDEAYFSCKDGLLASSFVFQKSLGDGITRDSAGKYAVRVSPTDTTITAGRYYYDFEVRKNSDVFTIMRGVLDVLQNVT